MAQAVTQTTSVTDIKTQAAAVIPAAPAPNREKALQILSKSIYKELRENGYEPKQILLLHASQLEADHIGELMDMLRKRGYRFITLEDALGDQAYSLPDMYVGEEGTGWFDHWAITMGKPPQGAPAFPQWVVDRSKALQLPQGTVPVTPPAQ